MGDAEGAPVPVTPEGIDALLQVWPIFEAFQAGYGAKGLLLDAEKKRLRALADWHFGGGDRYGLRAGVPGLPGAAEPAGEH